MTNHKSSDNLIHYSLGILLLVVAINAFAGGYYGMAGAENVPVAWLKGSPFHSYLIPSLVLFVGVGGLTLIAAILLFKRHRIARKVAFISGITVLLWLTVQLIIIGYVSWMQPTTGVVAIIILFLTWQLMKHGH